MKIKNVVEALNQITKDHLMSGPRPEYFKYKGPDIHVIHWFEEDGNGAGEDALAQLNKIQTGEFCASSVSDKSLYGVHGLLFFGKPEFDFPTDVASIYDEETGQRRLIPKDELMNDKKHSTLNIYHVIVNNHHRVNDYNEYWCLAKNMQFKGIVLKCYGKRFYDLIQDLNQAEYVLQEILDIHEHNIDIFLLDDKQILELITKEMIDVATQTLQTIQGSRQVG